MRVLERHRGGRRGRRAGPDRRAQERRGRLLGMRRAPRNRACCEGRRAGSGREAQGSSPRHPAAGHSCPGSDERGRASRSCPRSPQPWATSTRGRRRLLSSGGLATSPPTPSRRFGPTPRGNDPFLSTVSIWVLARMHPEDTNLRRAATEHLMARLKDQDALCPRGRCPGVGRTAPGAGDYASDLGKGR